jgi:hypothetical protein
MNNLPAFPIVIDMGDGVKYQNGMTLRDYFAAKAMQALLRQYPDHLMNSPSSEVASDAYSMADAMMKVREA